LSDVLVLVSWRFLTPLVVKHVGFNSRYIPGFANVWDDFTGTFYNYKKVPAQKSDVCGTPLGRLG
jgi:hypothetical protein